MMNQEPEIAYEESKAPFREKTAWLALIAMVVAFGPYFAIVAASVLPRETLPDVRELVLFGVAAVAMAIIQGIGYLYLSRVSPEEARTPPDERDLAIMRRAMSVAYYVLIAGVIEVGVIMPFNSSGWVIINAALFAIVVAELVRNSVIVFSYRRQAA
jgi:hypothetical protein